MQTFGCIQPSIQDYALAEEKMRRSFERKPKLSFSRRSSASQTQTQTQSGSDNSDSAFYISLSLSRVATVLRSCFDLIACTRSMSVTDTLKERDQLTPIRVLRL